MGECRTCGVITAGSAFDEWVKPTFTDHDKIGAGQVVCNACLFCFDDHNTELTRRTGKEKPQRMRNYSHFVLAGEWIPLGKADKALMRSILVRNPEVAIVAASGQKHLAFRCPPGWWQIEDTTVRPFPDSLQTVLAIIEPAYEAGISKTELESGRYNQQRILMFGLARWRRLESVIGPLRGTVQLKLALFLAQKDEDDDEPSTDS